MPIRRPRAPKPTLRHVAQLEQMSAAPEGGSDREGAYATFLALRLLDAWVMHGKELADPEMQTHRITRESVRAIEGDDELKTSLASILDAIVALHDPDPQPLLPRVYALARLFEVRARTTQAADIYHTVARYVNVGAHPQLAFDAHLRYGICLRNTGEYEWAEQAFGNAAAVAARSRDRARVVQARAAAAKILYAKGDLPAADKALAQLGDEAETLGATHQLSMILHDRSGIARMRNDLPLAVRFAFDALRITTDESERERVLVDLANVLNLSGAHDSARDAMRILERSAKQAVVRWSAQINLMEIAGKNGDENTFQHYRHILADEPLGTRERTSYLYDSGVGLMNFAHYDEARGALWAALQLAETSGENQRIFQIEAALKSLEAAERERNARRAPVVSTEAPEDISRELRRLLAEVEAVA